MGLPCARCKRGSDEALDEDAREMLWDMLAHQRNPKPNTVLVLGDERTIQALVRRGLLRAGGRGGYTLNESAAKKALRAA